MSQSDARVGQTVLEPAFVHRSPLRTIVIGTLGSLLLTFGSFGIGWLAPSSAFRQSEFIISLRYTGGAVLTCIVVAAVGAMIMAREWLRLSQKVSWTDRRAGRWVWAAIISWTTPLLFSFPLFSRDIYSYFAQGHLYRSGLNPYESGVSSVNNFFQYGADPLWAQSPPPYGPVFMGLEGLVVDVAGADVDLGFYLFRLVAVLGCALIAYYVPRIAELHGVNPVRARWLCLANPMFLVHFIASAHNDALMIGLMLAGVYYAARWRNHLGGILGVTLVTLAVSVKPIGLVALPFIGLLWAGKNASWPRKFLFWFLSLALCVGELWAMGEMNGFGFDWIKGLSTTEGVWIWYAPVGAFGFLAGMFANAHGLHGGDIQAQIFKVAQMAGMLGAGLMALLTRDKKIIRSLAIALALVVLLNPMIQSWYVVWLIPFFAATGIRADWHVDFYFLTTVFFSIWAVSDQLDVFPYLDFDLNMGRLVASTIALVYGLYLMFVDPSIRRVFRRTREQPVV